MVDQPKSAGSTSIRWNHLFSYEEWNRYFPEWESLPHEHDTMRKFLVFAEKFHRTVGPDILMAVKDIINDSIIQGAEGGSPESQRKIKELEDDIVGLKRQLAYADQRVSDYIAAAGGRDVYALRNALKPNREQELVAQIGAMRSSHTAKVEQLEELIIRQRSQLLAARADTSTEEGQFVVAQQYEREFTNTSHLMREIADLQASIIAKEWRIKHLETQCTQLKAENERLRTREEERIINEGANTFTEIASDFTKQPSRE